MPKQTFEEKIKAGKAKFKVIREGSFRRSINRHAIGVALRRDKSGVVYIEKIVPAGDEILR